MRAENLSLASHYDNGVPHALAASKRVYARAVFGTKRLGANRPTLRTTVADASVHVLGVSPISPARRMNASSRLHRFQSSSDREPLGISLGETYLT